jgi:hypothetical protein
MKITKKALAKALKQAVEAKGKNYIQRQCVYVGFDAGNGGGLVPVCILGCALVEAGVRVEDLLQLGGQLNDIGGWRTSASVGTRSRRRRSRLALQPLQSRADAMWPWGEATEWPRSRPLLDPPPRGKQRAGPSGSEM